MDHARPTRHLRSTELVWFDLPDGALADVIETATRHSAEFPGLAARLAGCRRAAWRCEAYLAFPGWREGALSDGALLWEGSRWDYVVDLDASGEPIGVEFLSVWCRSR